MIFGVPIGCNFIEEAAAGLLVRHPDPADMASTTIVVNGRRTAKVLKEALAKSTIVLPKIIVENELVRHFLPDIAIVDELTKISNVLAIAELLRKLAEVFEGAFNPHHRFELAYSLIELLDQMVERDLTPDELIKLDLGEYAEHWRRNSQFFQVLVQFWQSECENSSIYQQNRQLDRLVEHWKRVPWSLPIYVIGSTGSRPIMRRAMKAIIALPISGIVVPAVDFDSFDESRRPFISPENPQFGVIDLCDYLGVSKPVNWTERVTKIACFVATAFASASTTDLWLERRDNFTETFEMPSTRISFIDAPTPSLEVKSVFAAIHEAWLKRKSIVVATSDRNLVRSLVIQMHQFGIAYDDSSGNPMHLTPSGIFAGLVLDFFKQQKKSNILAMLGHPFVDQQSRGAHLRWLRLFERETLRQQRGKNPWTQAANNSQTAEYTQWIEKWGDLLTQNTPQQLSFSNWVKWHLDVMRKLVALDGNDWGTLSAANKGDTQLFEAMQSLMRDDQTSAQLNFDEYTRLWLAWVIREKSSDRGDASLACVKILGAIEARSETADRVIFAGMNEGSWPSLSIPEMWLNRDIRNQLGLEIPERFIGLAAHDFISGFSAPELIISRSLESDGAPSVESRFVTRIKTFMEGVASSEFVNANERGSVFLDQASRMDLPSESVMPEPRPAILLDVQLRPHQLSVSSIESFISTPYSFYAARVLKLREWNGLKGDLSPKEKGAIWHEFFESLSNSIPTRIEILEQDFLDQWRGFIQEFELDEFTAFQLDQNIESLAHVFLPEENERRKHAIEIKSEVEIKVDRTYDIHNYSLFARADRIDVKHDGEFGLYDYKSGASSPFSNVSFTHYQSQQLPITAMILEQIYPNASIGEIAVLKYAVKQGGKGKTPLGTEKEPFELVHFKDEFERFIASYFQNNRPWVAQRHEVFESDYNHLMRYGEWLESDEFKVIEVGK